MKNKYNILNITERDSGGAGIVSRNLNNLLNREHNSILIVKTAVSKDNNVIAIDKIYKPNIIKSIYSKIKKLLKKYVHKRYDIFFHDKYSFYDNINVNSKYTAKDILKLTPFKPDIIILHWVSNFINPKTIYDLKRLTGSKIFWIMMDNAPITGGCHYPWDCIGFLNNCSNCPAIISNSKKHIAKNIFLLKKKYLTNIVNIIACSESDYIRAKNSALFKKSIIHKFILPVNEKIYKPGNKYLSKSFFNIDKNKKIIFCGAITLGRERKGGKYLIKALQILMSIMQENNADINKFLILYVSKHRKNVLKDINIPILQLPFLNEKELVTAYQASHVFVSPSIEESGPLMINQSIMCGTPVVSFDVGIAKDLVITGQTGYKAALKDSRDMANGIWKILNLDNIQYRYFCDNCRNLGMSYSENTQINKLIKIFSS